MKITENKRVGLEEIFACDPSYTSEEQDMSFDTAIKKLRKLRDKMQEQCGDGIGIYVEVDYDYTSLIVFTQREETEEERVARKDKEDKETRIALIFKLADHEHPRPRDGHLSDKFGYERSCLIHNRGWDKMTNEELQAELDKRGLKR